MTAATIETRADLSTADLNNLPDSAFAYIEPGGSKDASGKTVPRSKRHFAIHDKAHADNAAARIAQGAKFGAEALPAVKAAQKKFGEPESKSAQRDPKWEQRRKRWAGSLIRQAARRSMPFARGNVEVRSKPDGTGGTNFEFHGYGAVFDAPFDMWDPWGDPYSEVVRQGAFSRTLGASPDVPFLIGHNDAGVPLARTRSGTMTLSQDTHGLEVLALMDGRRGDVRDLASAVERGDLDEMSIGFVTMGQEWSPDWETRAMLDLELNRGDVSAVALAANPATAGSSMTAFPAEVLRRAAQLELRSAGEIEDTGTRPDFNVPQDDPANNGKGPGPCPHGQANGCNQMVPGDAKYCPNCGGAVYQGDGTLVVDDSGVVGEEGNMGDASLLSAGRDVETMQRRLQLLRLSA